MIYCRWKDKDGNHLYECFIPEVDRPVTGEDVDVPDPEPGEKRKRQGRRKTEKGAMYHDYSRDLHEWLTHLRRVHSTNPPLTVNGKLVKASNPLAPPGESLYYVHSKTAYYNSFFFEFWQHCFARTFRQLCPFYDVDCVEDLEILLNAKVKR